MKRFVSFCVLALTLALILSGCGKDSEQSQSAPAVTPPPGAVTVFDMSVFGDDVINAVKAAAEGSEAKYEEIDEQAEEESHEKTSYARITLSGSEATVDILSVVNTESRQAKMITLSGSVAADEFYQYVSEMLAQFDDVDNLDDNIEILKILPDDEIKTRTVELPSATIYCEYTDGFYFLRAMGKE